MPESSMFIFIADQVESLPVTGTVLIDGLTLARPDEYEMAAIKNWLDGKPKQVQLPYRRSKAASSQNKNSEPEPLATRKGKSETSDFSSSMWAILRIDRSAPHADPYAADTLQLVANLLEPGLQYAVWFDLHELPGHGIRTFMYLLSGAYIPHGTKVTVQRPPVVIPEEYADQFLEVAESLSLITAGYPSIMQAVRMLEDLHEISPGSSFQVLGLFGVIEALLTRSPREADVGDSIKHQLSSKIPLLLRRMDRSPDSTVLFGDVSAEKVWSRLYEYRSCVAHGRAPDWGKTLACLHGPEPAHEYLRQVTKALLRHALREPQLVTDLREC